ncbi:MAG: addiction module protein [Pyrinomonadaceae bacterium]|nr:addiction module protein [Acidobacteriota bacterium]MBP7475862.1 addiction module protein [Pyrinomonadaceae bacterium]MBP9110258.1 addiction module protein [Pyrinomonadaceae bacterium]
MISQTAELIETAESLPVEMRIEIVNRLLESIHPTDPEIDEYWMQVAERRSEEVRSGKVKLVPGEAVFAKIKERYGE